MTAVSKVTLPDNVSKLTPLPVDLAGVFGIKFNVRPFCDGERIFRMKIYGYCRISRKTQSIDRQVRNIRAAYPDAVILQESFTGTKVEGRKEFEKLLM